MEAQESQVGVPSSHHAGTDSNAQVVGKVNLAEKCGIAENDRQALPDNTVKLKRQNERREIRR